MKTILILFSIGVTIVLNNFKETTEQNAAASEPVQERCLHCKQTLHTAREQAIGFCCSGCQAAYHFIRGLGLEYFYCLREKENTIPAHAAERPGTYSFYNDQTFAAQFIQTSEMPGVNVITLKLSGLTCSACVWLLEKLPLVVTGLLEVRVNLFNNRVTVRFENERIRPSAIAQSIASLGYIPEPVSICEQDSKERKIDRRLLIQIGVAAFCAMNVMLLFIGQYQGYFSGIEQSYSRLFAWGSMLLSLPAVTYAALPFYQTSLAALRMRRLHIDQPIAVAILAGFIASSVNTILHRPEIYFDTVTALIFLLLCGRWVQRKALDSLGDSSAILLAIAPLRAKRLNESGYIEEIFVQSLKAGDQIIVDTSERLPCDGAVVSGTGFVNNALLTGESRPVEVSKGSQVFAGTTNAGPELKIIAACNISQSRIGRLVEKISSTSLQDSRTARFVDQVSIYFVIAVFSLAIMTFIYWSSAGLWTAWDRVLALLVVSCPCALGIATPVILHLTANNAAKRGILLRSAESLERLAHATRYFFDKTGTITSGEMHLSEFIILNSDASHAKIWGLVHSLERHSSHPFAATLLKKASEEISDSPEDMLINEIPGYGVIGKSPSHTYRLGSIRWLERQDIQFGEESRAFIENSLARGATLSGLADETSLLALFSVTDDIRPEAKDLIDQLKQQGIESHLLSGDSQSIVNSVADKAGINRDLARGELSPEQKGELVSAAGANTAFIGDGINDLLAFRSASVGIGIIGGAEACLTVADIFLTRPDLFLLNLAASESRKTLRLIHAHLYISLFYNICAASLAIMGYIGPLSAALIMPLSSLSVITSSLLNAPFKEKKI